MKDYEMAESYSKRALSIFENTLPKNHPKIINENENLNSIRQAMYRQ